MLKTFLKYLVARGVSGAVTLAGLALLTRLLTREEYGRYALVVAAVSLASTVAFQWLRLGFLRFRAVYAANESALLATTAACFLSLACALGIAGGIAAVFVTANWLRTLVVLGILLLWAQAWFELNLDRLIAEVNPRRYGILSTMKAVTGVGGAAILAWRGFGANGALLGLLVGFTLPGLWEAVRAWRGVRLRQQQRGIRQALFAYGLPLTGNYALDVVVSSSDRFLLGLLSGAAAAGTYAAVYDFSSLGMGMLMLIVNLGAFPLAVKALEEGGVERARAQLRVHGTFLFGLALPAAAGLGLLAHTAARVFFGRDFQGTAVLIIPVVAAAALLGGMKVFYFDLSFQLSRSTATQVWVVLASAITNVLLNLLWIPRWLGLGAAWATLVAYAVGLALSWILGLRRFPLPIPWDDWGRISLATALMALALLPFRQASGALGLVGLVGLGASAYLSALLLLNVGGIRDRATRHPAFAAMRSGLQSQRGK